LERTLILSQFAPHLVHPNLGYNGKFPPYNMRAIHPAWPVEEPHYEIPIKEGIRAKEDPAWKTPTAFGF
jgi:hypothetical protein